MTCSSFFMEVMIGYCFLEECSIFASLFSAIARTSNGSLPCTTFSSVLNTDEFDASIPVFVRSCPCLVSSQSD